MKWQKKFDDEAVSPVIAIILMVAITVVLAGVLYVWVTSLADTTAGVGQLRFDAEIEIDDSALPNGEAYLTLTHRGGDVVTWGDYKVTMDGKTVTPDTATETSVGESATFTYAFTVANEMESQEKYIARIINLETDNIDWEDEITAKAA